jgi:colicin import membrane protein
MSDQSSGTATGDSGTATGDAGTGGDAAPADTGDAGGAAPAVDPAAPAGTPPAAEPAPAVEARANVTARLAALSKQNREAARATRAAEQRAAAAEAKAAEWDAIAAKAASDPATMDRALAKLNVNFEQIVNRYADANPELTPEQAQAKAVEELRADLAAQKKAIADEKAAAQAQTAQRQAQAARIETIGSISQTIAKQAEKYEICARLGDEAANDVFSTVVQNWKAAGQPQLMPGEFEDAVAAAIELQELRYEERGKKLAKAAARAAAPANGTPGAKTALAPKGDALPDGLIGGSSLSDKDADILKGLTDKTAPAYESQRAKPRTINSSLGGSAPPRTPARGAMDPRDALREVLIPFQR